MVEYKIVSIGSTKFDLDGIGKFVYTFASGDPTVTAIYEDPTEVMLIDPGYGEWFGSRNVLLCRAQQKWGALVSALEHQGIEPMQIKRIFLTHPHPDHRNLVKKFLERGARLIENRADEKIMDGVMILYAPGHHVAHFSLFLEETRVIIAGDAIINERYYEWNEYYRPNGYSAEEILETLQTMERLGEIADIIIPGHGGPFRPKSVLRRQANDTLDMGT